MEQAPAPSSAFTSLFLLTTHCSSKGTFLAVPRTIGQLSKSLVFFQWFLQNVVGKFYMLGAITGEIAQELPPIVCQNEPKWNFLREMSNLHDIFGGEFHREEAPVHHGRAGRCQVCREWSFWCPNGKLMFLWVLKKHTREGSLNWLARWRWQVKQRALIIVLSQQCGRMLFIKMISS